MWDRRGDENQSALISRVGYLSKVCQYRYDRITFLYWYKMKLVLTMSLDFHFRSVRFLQVASNIVSIDGWKAFKISKEIEMKAKLFV